MSRAYYNDSDSFIAAWLRSLIAAGHIAPGDVDERSVTEVTADDIKGYTQCHFFAGIGGWSYAARLAGWPDDRPLWTGSPPCQPYSVAGKQAGQEDERHLWPALYRLIRERRPDVVMGEQVAAAIGFDWLSGVCDDLEAIGYDIGAAVIPACAVNAPHRRDRLWFVADTDKPLQRQRHGERRWLFAGAGRDTADRAGIVGGDVADADLPGTERQSGVGGTATREPERLAPGRSGARAGTMADAIRNRRGAGRDDHAGHDGAIAPATGHVALGFAVGAGLEGHAGHGIDGDKSRWLRTGQNGSTTATGHRPWDNAEWLIGADGKARRVKPGLRLLAYGTSGSVAVRRTIQQGGTSHEEEHWYSRVGALRGFGNAIVPQVAAEVIRAYMGFNS